MSQWKESLNTKMRKIILPVFLFTLLILCFSHSTYAVYNGFLPPSEKPVKVGIGVYLDNVDFIDEQKTAIEIVILRHLMWYDPRLKFAPINGNTQKVYIGDTANEVLNQIWHPQLDTVRHEDVNSTQQFLLKINYDGRVESIKKMQLTLDMTAEVSKFPFDMQQTALKIISLGYSADKLTLYKLPQFEGLEPSILIPNWKIFHTFKTEVKKEYYQNYKSTFYTYEYLIKFKRQALPYIIQIFIPLFIFNLICYMVMFITWELNVSLSTIMTIVLTMVAFQFLIMSHIPNTGSINFTACLIAIAFIFSCLCAISVIVFDIIEKVYSVEARHSIETKVWITLPILYIIATAISVFIYF